MTKKPSLPVLLLDRLKEKRGQFQHGGELEQFARMNGYEGETAKRRLREMTQPNHRNYCSSIEQRLEKGCVMYRYAEPINNSLFATRQ